MKIGTFVGQEFIPSTEEEKQYLLDVIKNNLCDKFDVKSVEFEQSTILSFIKVELFDEESNYRLSNGNLVKPRYIRFSFCSQNGYDEAEVGKFYEWEDGFKPAFDKHSYGLSIDIIGDERPYKSRTVNHYVGIRQTDYKYGTELSDLEMESSIDNLVKFINRMLIQKTKKNII